MDTALSLLRERLSCVTGIEDAPVAEAFGRVLARPVTALRSNPPAANAAVDGYAFAWKALGGGTEGDMPLQSGRAAAGHPFGRPLPKGHALRILTGAEIPEGADTVVLQEDVEAGENRVRFAAPRRKGANCRGLGEDASAGDSVLEAGARIGPGAIARLVAVGVDRVAVRTRLRVAVISTGDELLQPGAAPETPGIFDANRPMLAAMVSAFGHALVDLGACPDRAEAVRAALDRAAADAEAILVTGGASAGDEDHVSRLFREEGRVTSWRIAMKPGRPLALGLWRGVPVFGLPGNPVAAFVTALIFARPALGALSGAGWLMPRFFDVPAAFAKSKKAGRREYLRARLTPDGAVEAFHSEGSGLIGGLAWSDGLVELPDEAMRVVPGAPVRYLPYSSFGIGV